jgi:hypothetical protein
MRRFVFEDEQYEVKVTVDMPEQMHQQLRSTKQNVKEALRKLINFTIDKEEASDESEIG